MQTNNDDKFETFSEMAESTQLIGDLIRRTLARAEFCEKHVRRSASMLLQKLRKGQGQLAPAPREAAFLRKTFETEAKKKGVWFQLTNEEHLRLTWMLHFFITLRFDDYNLINRPDMVAYIRSRFGSSAPLPNIQDAYQDSLIALHKQQPHFLSSMLRHRGSENALFKKILFRRYLWLYYRRAEARHLPMSTKDSTDLLKDSGTSDENLYEYQDFLAHLEEVIDGVVKNNKRYWAALFEVFVDSGTLSEVAKDHNVDRKHLGKKVRQARERLQRRFLST